MLLNQPIFYRRPLAISQGTVQSVVEDAVFVVGGVLEAPTTAEGTATLQGAEAMQCQIAPHKLKLVLV